MFDFILLLDMVIALECCLILALAARALYRFSEFVYKAVILYHTLYDGIPKTLGPIDCFRLDVQFSVGDEFTKRALDVLPSQCVVVGIISEVFQVFGFRFV